MKLFRTDNHTAEIQGIAAMLLACFWFSVMAILVRHISETTNPFMMVLFRNLSSLILMLPWMLKFGIKNIRTDNPKLYLMRAVSAIVGMSTLFYALPLMKLTDAISLTFTTPLITTILAVLLLKERIGYHRVIGLIAGFIGVIVILRPSGDAFQYASIFILITATCWALSNILIKKLTASDDNKVIVFLMMLIMVPLSIPLAVLNWQFLTFEQLGWLFLLGFVANQAQFAMTYSYSRTDVSTVQPFDFSRLVFISILAYFIFGEILSLWTLLGATIIFISSLYVFYRQKNVDN